MKEPSWHCGLQKHEPTVLQAEDHIKEKLHTGLAESVALASVATTVRVTEGAALELLACALGGVADLMTGGGTYELGEFYE